MNMWPPKCELPGCVSHLAKDRPRCICPRRTDGGGVHLTEMNPGCPEHVVESHPGIEHGRAAMEWASRALGETRDV
jgi:hypothetical protein